MILGVDAGGDRVKVYGELEEMSFQSILGEYRERKLVTTFSNEDMIYEFNGQKGFAGTLAMYESNYAASMLGDNKAHSDLLIRVLIALHKYSNETEFKIVVGQPISKHDNKHKQLIKEMLIGSHKFTLNNVTKQINITHVEVAAEGAAAFWSSPRNGQVRLLDIGSGTVNGATLNNGAYIDKGSFTIKEGLNTHDDIDLEKFARKVATTALKKWEVDDTVLLVGGGAETLLTYLQEYFFNLQVLSPKVKKGGLIKEYKPIFANAIGFYTIAKKVYSNE